VVVFAPVSNCGLNAADFAHFGANGKFGNDYLCA
jgi:hypothetical protein